MDTNALIALISGAVGIILSILTTYFKPIALKFYAIPAEYRGLAMLGMNVLAVIAIFGLSCTPLFAFVPCETKSIWTLLTALFVGLGTNQLTFNMSPESPAKAQLRLEALIEAQKELEGTTDDPENDEN